MLIHCLLLNEVFPVECFFFYEFFSLFKDGRKESAMFDKITSRILKLSEGLDLDYVDPVCSKFTFAFFFEPIKFL